jgi:hypothetical protein
VPQTGRSGCGDSSGGPGKARARKTYLLSEDGLTAGAVYFWKDRASAERVYTDDWRKMVTEVYGASPQISFYHAPVTVENAPM